MKIKKTKSTITKEFILELKGKGNSELANFIKSQEDVWTINFILENMGRLPGNIDSTFLYELLNHQHCLIRLNAVKNISKLNGNSDTDKLFEQYKREVNTSVRQEIISSISKQKKAKNKPFLFEFLEDNDPKAVCQTIMGLLTFKKDKDVEERLKLLINHPSEMVRTMIYREYFAKTSKTKSVLPHPETFEFLKDTVVNADVLEVLKYVPDESIHLTFTSPPYYNARDYSTYSSYQAYLEFLDAVFKETYRITKEGRFLVVNTSPIIIPRVSRSHSSRRYPIPFDLHSYLIKQGWEFIDDIVWLKPEASVKNRIGGFMQHRKPLSYKPNSVTEYLMVYRKATEKLLDWNIKSYSSKTVEESKVADGYETTNVWKISPRSDKIHSAIFPVELCKRVIQYYSYKGDLIFDPFGGTGTVGKTAKTLERLFFLTEQETKYFEYMQSKFKEPNIFKERETQFLSLEQFKKISKWQQAR